MNKKILPWLITICALGLGGTAAYYSVIGLSKLFAGVATAVIIMASFLEISKLTLATLLHSYWDKLNKLSKIYYVTAVVVLSLITSMGIYGMLSSGYQETANKSGQIDSKIMLVENKRDNIQVQLDSYNKEKESINNAISDLRKGLANNVIQYKDKETGQIITTTSRSTRKSLEKQLEQALIRQDNINSKVDGLNEKIFDYNTEIAEIKSNNDLAGELGPLKYISELTGLPMDNIINYLLLTIIFVFDPLAIALVVAANFAFEKARKNTKINLYGEEVEKEEKTIYTSDGIISEDRVVTYPDSTQPVEFKPEEWVIKDFEVENTQSPQEDPTPDQPLEPNLDPNLSAWRRNKIKQQNQKEDLTKTY